ncbi:MarR family transcriptional regulator [Rhodococcus ruber]|uniref:MarR family transcriptional regulator n=2 Tax=Rhodococcus TaxID=1827 RepID=A0A0M9WN44_RHORH|nr:MULTISPECIES: MarR family transcriptional regulator [Rhodococcus]AXY54654.1 MarR family transcriptional regulator [Rhodococcus ruber]KOS55187.1 MarR family transcriptional regulator [Rhodococcus rhodochrous KG-21]MDM7489755.1 MarR family transcriptional regulator [Rhodococcus indonesiensis]MDO1479511.1 MarR family transcriptional regulator [Rhodococcus ruber]QRE78910.1 MarR family transcriptional regulator [Rhodococcus ruber]
MTKTRWLSDDEQRTWRAYLDSTRLLMNALDRQLTRDSGMSLTDYELLVALSEAPGRRLRMRALADAVVTTRSGVTRAISRLVDAGWVRRVECDEDKRGTLAELTDAGATKLAQASPGHVEAVRSYVFDLLGPQDVTRFGDTYTAMRTHLLENT